MTREEVAAYCRENKDAMKFADIAAKDYIACRCCMLNYLQMGAVLGSQSVEKILKSALLLIRKDISEKEVKKFKHGIWSLVCHYKDDLIEIYPDILKHENLFKKLDIFYESRYSWGASMTLPNDLYFIDNIFLYLLIKLPMPDEVKFRSGFFVTIFDDHIMNHSQVHWSVLNNNVFIVEHGNLKKKYESVMEILYGKKII